MKPKLMLLAGLAAICLAAPAIAQILPLRENVVTTHRWMQNRCINSGGRLVCIPSHWHPTSQGCAACQRAYGGGCQNGVCTITPIVQSSPAVSPAPAVPVGTAPNPYRPPASPTNPAATTKDLKTEIIKIDNEMLEEIIRRTSTNVITHIESNPAKYRGTRGEAGPQGNVSTGPRGPAGPPGADGKDGNDGEDAVVDFNSLRASACEAAVQYVQSHADEFRGPAGAAGEPSEVDYDRLEQSAVNAAVGYLQSNTDQFRGPPGADGGSLDLASISDSDYEKLVMELKRRIAGAIRVRVEPVRK